MLILRYTCLGILIIYLILKIILKERQERKQQRLQENAVSPAFAGDDLQDGERGGDDQALEQLDPSGTKVLLVCFLKNLEQRQPCAQAALRALPSPGPCVVRGNGHWASRTQKFSDVHLDCERTFPWAGGAPVPLLWDV